MKNLARLATVVAIAASAAIGTASGANAERDYQVVDAQTGCKLAGAGWGSGGSFIHVYISDDVTWHSRTHVQVNRSYTRGRLINCNTGGLQTSGDKKLNVAYTVLGQGITSCTIAIAGGCTLSDTTTATSSFTTGWNANTNGEAFREVVGADAYARTGHSVTDYFHSGSAEFRRNGQSFEASRTIHFVNNS